jgi:hypothetical protein
MAIAIPGTSNVFMSRATYASRSAGGPLCANKVAAQTNAITNAVLRVAFEIFIAFSDSLPLWKRIKPQTLPDAAFKRSPDQS